MASISDLIASGLGSWSTVAKVPTHGMGIGTIPVLPVSNTWTPVARTTALTPVTRTTAITPVARTATWTPVAR